MNAAPTHHGVWKIECDICHHRWIATMPCNENGEWPIESGGAECPECENMTGYPQDGLRDEFA